MAKRAKTLADTLRDAIAVSGLSARKLADATGKNGVSQQAVSLFIAGGDVRTGTAEKLARVLGMKLELRGGA